MQGNVSLGSALTPFIQTIGGMVGTGCSGSKDDFFLPTVFCELTSLFQLMLFDMVLLKGSGS